MSSDALRRHLPMHRSATESSGCRTERRLRQQHLKEERGPADAAFHVVTSYLPPGNNFLIFICVFLFSLVCLHVCLWLSAGSSLVSMCTTTTVAPILTEIFKMHVDTAFAVPRSHCWPSALPRRSDPTCLTPLWRCRCVPLTQVFTVAAHASDVSCYR